MKNTLFNKTFKPISAIIIGALVMAISFIVFASLCMWGCPDTFLPKLMQTVFWFSSFILLIGVIWLSIQIKKNYSNSQDVLNKDFIKKKT